MRHSTSELFVLNAFGNALILKLDNWMTAGIDNNDRIESFFDGISYQKGGAVLRMLRAWLTRRDDRSHSWTRLMRRRRSLQQTSAVGAEWRFVLHLVCQLPKSIHMLGSLRPPVHAVFAFQTGVPKVLASEATGMLTMHPRLRVRILAPRPWSIVWC